ncbi:Xaa-Pro aminopeptidase [Candidatus Pantoea edessiphila]|uniref:Xaa-Pro aminopeptidase n=1 Tax=Candidatus Pantoea edessiphila TaxID=2044610 RepID=A0A2P5SXL0_9GAMM|nr:Xaa-Pro aminopeptidase [Candidatus Pantoea edessiphila]MBK4775700.1 Xaa-Pro aminopeptidase [Pantoea sp. Edef]PPI87069.1 Xaa-Pro aminopeptidase [Candidatus Pantoea edessiphila]
MISINILKNRRKKIISQMVYDSAILLFATPDNKQNKCKFNQNKDFWYFTGFNEPDSLLVMIKKDDKFIRKILFNRSRDFDEEIWVGRRLGQDAALSIIDVDYAFPWNSVYENLYKLLSGLKVIYHAWGEYAEVDQLVLNVLKYLNEKRLQGKGSSPNTIIDWRPLVHKMRLFKDLEEINYIRTSGKISALAHTRAMKYCRPGIFEYQLEGEIHHEFYLHGSRFTSYDTIIGSGINSCILHYTQNNTKMRSGDLVLVDAGCNFNEYASDITRTFPVNGKFTQQQRDIYNIVLNSLKTAASILKPNISIRDINNIVIQIMINDLIKLGLLTGTLDEIISKGSYRKFFMHNLSHWLGLDVHDVGYYDISINDQVLKPNMVLTIEPGIYILPDIHVPNEYHGIGVRIEDNFIITETGNECTTSGVVKEIKDIENTMESLKEI